MHPTWAPRSGFHPLTALAQDCRHADELAGLVFKSSCTPPFVPIQYRHRQPLLDGGLIENCPVATVADVPGPSLVLLTRRYPPDRITRNGDRRYVQPSRNPLISRWDYTNAKGLQTTFDLGRRDGEVFLNPLTSPYPSAPAASA